MGQPEYPEHMRIREGTILLTESDWPTVFGRKYGVFLVGAGSIAKDTDHIWGGTGSVALTTGALTFDQTEIKISMPQAFTTPKILAFEHKFIPDLQFGANHYAFGFEDRKSVTPFLRAKILYTVTGDKFEYESASGVFTAMPDGGATIDRPFLSGVNGAGDKWAWTRLVVDFDKGEYVSFEYESISGYKKIDMTGIALPEITTGDTTTQMLVFALGETPTTTVTTYYTADWIVTKVPF